MKYRLITYSPIGRFSESPYIDTHGKQASVNQNRGTDARLDCKVIGKPNATGVTWFKDGKELICRGASWFLGLGWLGGCGLRA